MAIYQEFPICGYGMNWQVCSNTAFVGLSDSFESIFQATKRFPVR